MDRETLRVDVADICLVPCKSGDGELCEYYKGSCSICRADRILSLPTIARALAALEDLEAGKMVRLAEDQDIVKLSEIIEGCAMLPEGRWNHEFDSWADWNKYRRDVLSKAQRVVDAGFRRVEAVKTEDSECRWCFRVVGDEGMCSHCPRRVEAEKGEQQ